MTDKKVKMPEHEQMMQMLIGINDDPHPVQRLYPSICRTLAGQEKAGAGVVVGLTLAVHDYCQNMPSVVSSVFYNNIPLYVGAIVPDEEVRRDAIAFYEHANGFKDSHPG